MIRRKRPPRYDVPRRAKITPHHCFYLAWHHLALIFLFCSIGGIAIGYFLVPVFSPNSVSAATAESNSNVSGWAFANTVGWISLSDQNTGSGSGVGTYGVNLDFSTGELTGFGWSEKAGWICFGSSCGATECDGTVPTSNRPYNVPYAAVVPAPSSADPIIRNVHGWAKVCDKGDSGWISLNCSDPLPSACGAYPYRVPFDMSTRQFTDTSAPGSPNNGTSFAWNGNSDGSGIGYLDFHLAYVRAAGESVPSARTGF